MLSLSPLGILVMMLIKLYSILGVGTDVHVVVNIAASIQMYVRYSSMVSTGSMYVGQNERLSAHGHLPEHWVNSTQEYGLVGATWMELVTIISNINFWLYTCTTSNGY